MKKFNPVLILVYDRLEHFKKCIESLASCPEAKYTELYISSDFYRNNNEKPSVLGVRQYINKIKGFKNVTPFFFNENQGPENAFNYSINKIFEHHEDVIISEDDNVFSPLFLTYMNRMTNYYKNDKKVFAISGFSTNILTSNYELKSDSLYATSACSVWGYALTKERYFEIIDFFENKKLYEILRNDLNNNDFINKLNKVSRSYYPHFLDCFLTKKKLAFDHAIAYYCLKNDLINLHNSNTYVKNFGHDGTGNRSERDLTLEKLMLRISFSKGLPKLLKSETIPLKNELIGFHSNSKLKYLIKILLIKLRLFDLLKNPIKRIIYR